MSGSEIGIAIALGGLILTVLTLVWRGGSQQRGLKAEIDMLRGRIDVVPRDPLQTREQCANHRAEVAGQMAEIESAIALVKSVADRQYAVMIERIEALTRMVERLELLIMTYYDRENLTPPSGRPRPKRVPPMLPEPGPNNDEGEQG